MRLIALSFLFAVAVAGCGSAEDSGENIAAPAPVPAVREDRLKAAVIPGCLPAPAVGRHPGFADEEGGWFGDSSDAFRATAANFAAAYRRSCQSGILKDASLFSGAKGSILLSNAPDANIAAIAADGPGGAAILEYPFVASDGSVNIPRADEIEEAIYCAVRGSTEQEMEASGRCLPD